MPSAISTRNTAAHFMTADTQDGESISVLIPTYNRAALLQKSIESVLAQTHPADEILIIDDGSTDDTAAVVKQFGNSVRYHRPKKRLGTADARNFGIEQSSGNLIALLDHDDLWLPDKLQWQKSVLAAHPEAVMVCGSLRCIDEKGNPAVGEHLPHLPDFGGTDAPYYSMLRLNTIVSPGQTLIRRTALEKIGRPIFDKRIVGSDDWDVWLRLAQMGGCIADSRTALLYRLHTENASRDLTWMYLGGLRLYAKQLKLHRNNRNYATAIRSAKADFERLVRDNCMGGVHARLAQQDYIGAITEYTRLIRSFPHLLLRKMFRRLTDPQIVSASIL